MTKHIIFICNEYPPSSGGGIGTFYQTLGRELVRQGMSVTVGGIYPDHKKVEVSDDLGVKVWRLPASPRRRGTYRVNMYWDRLRLGRWAARQMTPDSVLEAPDYQGWLWGVPTSCKPRVIRTHGPDVVFLPLIGVKPNRLKAHFERVSLRKAEAILSITRYMSEQIAAVLQNRQNSSQIETTIYNMVDVEAYSPAENVRRDPLSVASVATLTRRKGVYQLLEAWRIVHAAVPDARLTFYGRDTNVAGASVLAELQALTAEYKLTQNVTFAGAVPVTDVVHVLRREGIIVYPSYIEAGPLAWLEAMATASPVIASSRGPGPEIIEEGVTGYLIDPDNVSQLADRIIALLKNPAQGERLGRTARHEVVRRFSFDAIIPQNIEFFKSLHTQ